MEKTVDKKLNKNQSQDLKELIDGNKKKQKGPKTIIKDDLIKMKGDPLGLHVPLDDEPKESLNVDQKIKSKDEIVVERYNPDITLGLSSEEVELRQMAGLANVSDTGSSKSIPSIITSNIFTFFNFLNFAIAFSIFYIS